MTLMPEPTCIYPFAEYWEKQHCKMSTNSHSTTDKGTGKKKSLILNAFVEMCESQAIAAVHPRPNWLLLSHPPAGSGHQSPGLWQHPDDQSSKFNDVEHWVELAKLLESAKFHGIFIADVLGTFKTLRLCLLCWIHEGGYDVYNSNLDAAIQSGAQWPVNEPLAVIPAMAAATKSLGFGVTVATTYEQPYHLARRLSTVDHLSKGRYACAEVYLIKTADERTYETD